MLQGWELYLAVFGVGVFASYVGSISGGGGRSAVVDKTIVLVLVKIEKYH